MEEKDQITPEETTEETPEEGSESEEQGQTDNGEGEGNPAEPEDEVAKLKERNSGLMSSFNKEQERANALESELKKIKESSNESGEELPPYAKDDWNPKTAKDIADAIRIAEFRGEKKVLEKLQEIENEKKEAQEQVDSFVEEVKSQNKDFNEKDFFSFAVKHNFPVNSIDDLKAIYSVYKDVGDSKEKIEKKTRDNVLKRKGDTVSQGKGGKDDGFSVPFSQVRQRSTYDLVRDALGKLK